MKVIFSHGKESGPWGSKITLLANTATTAGFAVDSIDYSDLSDPDQRVERLLSALDHEPDPCLLVGSSMGGYVSLVTAEQAAKAATPDKSTIDGVFLLAPALYLPGYQVQHYGYKGSVAIVHGWSDDIIAPEQSIRYAKTANCTLHLIAGDHRLNGAIDQVETLFGQFLQNYSQV